MLHDIVSLASGGIEIAAATYPKRCFSLAESGNTIDSEPHFNLFYFVLPFVF
jgi:hypothetical protein